GALHGEVERVRVGWVAEQVRLVAGAVRLPRVVAAGAVEVVRLHVGEVEVPEYLAEVPAVRDLHLVGRGERGQQVVLAGTRAERVELRAELGQQRGQVGLVRGTDVVARVALATRPLPVDVDAVEDVRRRSRPADAVVRRQVPLD